MREIGAFEAKNKLAELLDLAEKGEGIIITRHGKKVARLGPIQKSFAREAARRAVATIKELRKSLSRRGLPLDDATIKEYINEGRP